MTTELIEGQKYVVGLNPTYTSSMGVQRPAGRSLVGQTITAVRRYAPTSETDFDWRFTDADGETEVFHPSSVTPLEATPEVETDWEKIWVEGNVIQFTVKDVNIGAQGVVSRGCKSANLNEVMPLVKKVEADGGSATITFEAEIKRSGWGRLSIPIPGASDSIGIDDAQEYFESIRIISSKAPARELIVGREYTLLPNPTTASGDGVFFAEDVTKVKLYRVGEYTGSVVLEAVNGIHRGALAMGVGRRQNVDPKFLGELLPERQPDRPVTFTAEEADVLMAISSSIGGHDSGYRGKADSAFAKIEAAFGIRWTSATSKSNMTGSIRFNDED